MSLVLLKIVTDKQINQPWNLWDSKSKRFFILISMKTFFPVSTKSNQFWSVLMCWKAAAMHTIPRKMFTRLKCKDQNKTKKLKKIPGSAMARGFDKTLTPGQLTPYWPPTDPPYWPPIKSMGKWKLQKPRTINGPDSSSSINLAYLKLPRWRSRCRFPTLVLLLLFSGGFVDGKSSTE